MSDAEFDHIHPVNLGGTNDLDNCRTLCKDCHRFKTNGGEQKATTYGSDVHEAAKVKRLSGMTGNKKGKAKIPSRPMPGTKKSGWKKPFNKNGVRR